MRMDEKQEIKRYQIPDGEKLEFYGDDCQLVVSVHPSGQRWIPPALYVIASLLFLPSQMSYLSVLEISLRILASSFDSLDS